MLKSQYSWNHLAHTVVQSPVGPITLVADKSYLLGVGCSGDRLPFVLTDTTFKNGELNAILAMAADQLGRYFDGRLKKFALPIKLNGTAFQEKVWTELRAISYGELISYSELALRIGNPKATRAVAGAVGRNLHPIIIPCQRVIGRNGAMTGFASGLHVKRYLLELEGHDIGLASAPENEIVFSAQSART